MPHRLTFVIPDLDHEALKAMAEANDRSAGAEVRAALRRSLNEFFAPGPINEERPAEDGARRPGGKGSRVEA